MIFPVEYFSYNGNHNSEFWILNFEFWMIVVIIIMNYGLWILNYNGNHNYEFWIMNCELILVFGGHEKSLENLLLSISKL